MATRTLVFDAFDDTSAAARLCDYDGFEEGEFVSRRFPDGESWLRVTSDCEGARCVVFAGIHRPDEKALPLLFLADTLRDYGVDSVGLVVPYLPYMRQDQAFDPGEGVTSKYFASLLSSHFDWLVTVDPHLHRHGSLDDIYEMPTTIVESAPAVAKWLDALDEEIVIVGPDHESEQWVERVADLADAPHIILEKERLGDRDVRLTAEGIEGFQDHRPIVFDDIISTGSTMIETVARLSAAGYPSPICIGVHAVFSEDAMGRLLEAGAERVVTCNTIPHPTNIIDVDDVLAAAVVDVVE
ncbi:MAG: ribose-phosphate diphosphokinase [Myxococcota bacterium]